MTQVRILYRMRQFWRTLTIKREHLEAGQALAILNPEQTALYTRMQAGEQYHALKVYHRLLEQSECQADLLVAALLHDVGKLCYRLNLLERGMVVVVKTALPKLACRLGELPATGWEGSPPWRKAFIVAEHHPEWGAEMAHQAGVSTLAENLIRYHDRAFWQNADAMETSLLRKLWLVDNES